VTRSVPVYTVGYCATTRSSAWSHPSAPSTVTVSTKSHTWTSCCRSRDCSMPACRPVAHRETRQGHTRASAPRGL